MDDRLPSPSTDLTARLDRRRALRTYVPPAIAAIGAASVSTLGHSGSIRRTPRLTGQPGGSSGNPGARLGPRVKNGP
jgi:hypothetical protein